MKYSEWNSLSDEERKNTNWHKHPHIRTATIFTIAFSLAVIIIILGISKNSTVHINRKPTKTEAYNMARNFVKDRLKQPEKAVFANTPETSLIDTATGVYNITSWVKIENGSGKMEKSVWEVKMQYTEGDWAEKNSWKLISVNVN
ncbi:hypothetical protein LX99_03240 [Mucilaginibacter oryzae]|uniref:Cytochrome oxidase complex assembly protein 1 n=1 Tax=Mucilaginibacter oryzae TaxID=468058 RepID=A0A316HAK5_9SPHI|nr:hypothetical protein [Mucilaginibacter oryzae]PWK77427.1 hypothetical protein LX99_03240 [Mucilaginibacter oryzae]